VETQQWLTNNPSAHDENPREDQPSREPNSCDYDQFEAPSAAFNLNTGEMI